MTNFMKFMLRIRENISDLFSEILVGLKLASPFILSHHAPENYHKCIVIFNQRVCSRCFGIFIGFLNGLQLSNFFFFEEYYLAAIVLFPIPMLVDWYRSNRKISKSSNLIRAFSGFIFGIIYGVGIIFFLQDKFRAITLTTGLLYGLIAVKLLKTRIS